MGYRIIFTKQAKRDAIKLEQIGLDSKAKDLLKIVAENPFENFPPFEKLIGDLEGKFSRRINIHHRLVYTVLKEENITKIYRMWTHYE